MPSRNCFFWLGFLLGVLFKKTGKKGVSTTENELGTQKTSWEPFLWILLCLKNWSLDDEGSKDGANELHPSFDQHILDHGKRNMALTLKTLFLSSRP